MKHAIRHIHFVGIGGSGMSGIAEVLHNLGYRVSGSDIKESAMLTHLREVGITATIGHARCNIEGADCVVTSTAVQPDNPEVLAAKEQHIPVVARAVMLAELMRMKQGIAIAGTHGKTTTTSLVASVLAEAGVDPTFVIGGRLNSMGVNARLGEGSYIVVEADESDASFLNLLPTMAVVTNIDADHMDTYERSFDKLKAAFVTFLHKMPFWGAAVLCVEDETVRGLMDSIQRPITTYGFCEEAQIRAVDVRPHAGAMRFTVQRRNGVELPDLDITLNLAGRHNVLNALAAVAIATELDLPDGAIVKALAEFKGVGRRMQSYGAVRHQGKTLHLIDDYGHHPVELAATLEAVRGAYPDSRLLLAFQPHRYTRTRDCFEDFVKVLGEPDVVLLTEVYAAGEEAIAAADGRTLTRALRLDGRTQPVFVDAVEDVPRSVLQHVQDGDVVLCMGAGSIGTVAQRVCDMAVPHLRPVPASAKEAAA